MRKLMSLAVSVGSLGLLAGAEAAYAQAAPVSQTWTVKIVCGNRVARASPRRAVRAAG